MTEQETGATFAAFHAAMERIAAAGKQRTEIMLKFTRRVLERLDGSTPATVRCPEESPAVTVVRKWLGGIGVSIGETPRESLPGVGTVREWTRSHSNVVRAATVSRQRSCTQSPAPAVGPRCGFSAPLAARAA